MEALLAPRAHSQPTGSCAEAGAGEVRLEDLPLELAIAIFANLDARDLCMAAQTCRAWYGLASLDVIWRKLLRDELPRHLEALTHASVPSHQRLLMCPKESFLQMALYPPLPTTLPSSGATMPVVLFGRGLETHGDHLVNRFFWEHGSPFSVTGMAPGIGGFGSGVKVNFSSRKLNIITLYQRTAAERRRRDTTPGRLIEASGINVQTQQLCRNAGAFVYILDPTPLAAEDNADEIDSILFEINELLDRRWTSPATPLLLFACAPSAAPAPSLVRIAHMLQLSSLRRPWQLRKLPVEAWQTAMTNGITWLLHEARQWTQQPESTAVVL